MLYLIDSHAWIEYFIGSAKGRILRRLFLNRKHEFATLSCCIGEIRGWSLREDKDFEELYSLIRSNSSSLPVSEEEWIAAAEERHKQRKVEKGFGLIDAAILIKQKQLRCGIVSGDRHFRHLGKVVFLK